MKFKALISALIIATFVIVPLGANAEEVEVQPTTIVAEDSVVADYPEITGFENTAEGIKVSWSAYDGASKYRLFYWNGSMWKVVGTTSDLNFTHKGLTNETAYVYTVRALDSDGKNISDYNHEGYASTFLAPPVISSLSNTVNGVEIKWNKSDFADSYCVFRRYQNGSWAKLGVTSDNSFTDAKAESGKTYSYTVRMIKADGNSFMSGYNDGKSITYVKAPKISKIENTATGAKISWSKCAGASKYRVFYLDSNNSWKGLGTTTSTSYTHDKLKTGTTYKYTVRCLDSKGNFVSGFDKTGTSNMFITTPQIKSLTNINGGVEVKWGKLSGAESYRIYRKTQKSGWAYIGDSDSTTYVDKTVASGTNYAYTVRCLDKNGKLVSSYNNGKSITYVKTPKISKIENTATGAKISWSKCAGASKYRVFYLDSNNSWKGLGTTTSTSYTHDKLKTGTTYKYTVRCLDSKGNFVSGFDKTGTSNMFITTPQITSLSNIYDGVEVKWGKLSGAESYRIYRKTQKSGWAYIGDSDSTTYVDKTASSGTNYTYTVRCLDKNGKLVSSYNNGKSITYVKAPKISKIENTATGAKISWSKCAGASKYRVFYWNGTAWKGLGTTTSTSYTHDKLKTGTTYKYTVRCLDSKGNFVSGFDKTGTSNLFLAPPEISSVSKASNGNLIQWKAVAGASGYRLYRKTVGSSWSVLADITSGNSYVDTSVKSDNVYTYTLRCLDENGKLISSYISETKYYYNGSLANGTITVGSNKYSFNNGLFRAGLQTINGNKYYYNSSGVLEKNGIVGSAKDGYYYADKNGKIDFTYRNAVTQNGTDWNVLDGKATKVSTASDRTLFRALKIVAKITDSSMTKSQKLKVCFDYVKGAYTELNPRIPHYKGNDWPVIYANDMFVDGAGNCFSYAAAFAYMAKAIGYEDVYCCHSGGHGWAEIDGLVYDPEWSRHHFKYSYYALSYNAKTDVNYKAAISAGYSWMHVKI